MLIQYEVNLNSRLLEQYKGHKSNIFVCLEFFVTLENFSLRWRRHHYLWRAANVYLSSPLLAIHRWEYFNVPHLLWHGPILHNGHLHGQETLTLVAERLAVELFYGLRSLQTGGRTPISRIRGERSTTTPLGRYHKIEEVCKIWYMSLKIHEHIIPFKPMKLH